jgi:5'/3'-nucleotidase
VRLFREGRRSPRVVLLAFGVCAVLVGACGSPSAVSPPTTTSGPTLSIMVTNDDGVGAPGIDAAVQGLRALPNTRVTVVAPLSNKSGTGEKTTPTTSGRLHTSKAETGSGYPAIAVHGFPADTVIWAVRDHGLPFRPDLVVSGINLGQNVASFAGVSGTVGAAREAVSLGVPAIAASQGVDNGLDPDFSEGVQFLVRWITQHRTELQAHEYASAPPQANLNVPTCPEGSVRGPVMTVIAASRDGSRSANVNCGSTSRNYQDDLSAFDDGFAVLTPLYPPWPEGTPLVPRVAPRPGGSVTIHGDESRPFA